MENIFGCYRLKKKWYDDMENTIQKCLKQPYIVGKRGKKMQQHFSERFALLGLGLSLLTEIKKRERKGKNKKLNMMK